jgi:hypothetical protein
MTSRICAIRSFTPRPIPLDRDAVVDRAWADCDENLGGQHTEDETADVGEESDTTAAAAGGMNQ